MRSIGLVVLMALLGACADAQFAGRRSSLPAEAIAQPQNFLLITVANDPGAVAAVGSTPRAYGAAAGYVVSAAALQTVATIAHEYGMKAVASWPIATLAVHCVVFRRPDNRPLADLLEALAKDPRVQLAQALQSFNTLTSYNDTYASLQSSLEVLGIEQAHKISRGSGVKLVLIDTGVDTSHPDLVRQRIAVRNFVDNDEAKFAADLHGTEVAGVIAAQANNHIGIVGVAPAVKMTAMKACWQTSPGAHAVCNSFTLAQALAAAVNGGADIVNLSLTGPPDPLLGALLQWGVSRGVIFIAAVPMSGRAEGFPSALPGVISVDRLGATAGDARVLHAPGTQILTLTPGGHYDFASGSSIAAAHVSGVAALLMAHRKLTMPQVRALLAGSVSAAQGSVNACAALRTLERARASCASVAQTGQSDETGHAQAKRAGLGN